jgi:hypothetical protein
MTKKLIIKGYLDITMFIFILMFGCAGQVEEKQESTEKKAVKPPPPTNSRLAPGTAIVEARLLSFNEEEDHFVCQIKIEKALRYGSSTKPLGRGTELKLYISTAQTDLIKTLSEGTLEQKYEFTVIQEQVVNMSSGKSIWKVLKVKKIS